MKLVGGVNGDETTGLIAGLLLRLILFLEPLLEDEEDDEGGLGNGAVGHGLRIELSGHSGDRVARVRKNFQTLLQWRLRECSAVVLPLLLLLWEEGAMVKEALMATVQQRWRCYCCSRLRRQWTGQKEHGETCWQDLMSPGRREMVQLKTGNGRFGFVLELRGKESFWLARGENETEGKRLESGRKGVLVLWSGVCGVSG
ncbi:hypothetical protein NC653_007126 [Populus alba x Populus x berolinensis]|uniref:Uncharacterized protein n=2 Tax=Populus TaxID=3689 RepID=A0A4U5P435_POPAL|nr:hypothetical protein NC653_007126 [Populus alba x Populus x berolinensis]TKR90948.1 hypothetical protein D5086_0000228230 [Populus alba]